ncbi:SDR family oxidoreductase [Arthrobacter sp. NPDC080031]|uniref:SDR family NAD(P)-dependent oxidoreductase n=1 Tax=Arthrobacter sp. NPDC080031 TaxID=3155918 RepID=UPI0034510B80
MRGSHDSSASSLSGTALVIGTGGIGAQVCRDLAGQGKKVFHTYHQSRDAAEELSNSLGSASAGTSPLDIRDETSIREAVEKAASVLGQVDILVVTAGHRHEFARFVDTPAILAGEILEHELVGVMSLVRAVLPFQETAGYGRIVLVGSDSGKAGTACDAVSSAARGGLISFARSLARETAKDDITINVVCPGPTDTELLHSMLDAEGTTAKIMQGTVRAIPKRRCGTVGEVSAIVTFLAGDVAGYITGQAVSVSGGLTMS